MWKDGASLLNVNVYKNFFTWYYKSSKGRTTENGRCSLSTLKTTAKTIFGRLSQETGAQPSNQFREDIRFHLIATGAQDAKYRQDNMDVELFERILKRHWNVSLSSKGYGPLHSIPFSLCSKILMYTNCRIGAICRCQEYPDAGLIYRVC
jgi:hypothetical protein